MTSRLDVSLLTPELLARYDRPGPRYTSYPTAPQFSAAFGEASYRERLAAAARRADEPLSMYVHLPFCEARCTFCGCNVVISPRRGPEEPYLAALEAELELLAEALAPRRRLSQLHWGGGTPTYLDPAQCERLFEAITSRFPLADGAEVALEIDPCVTTMEHLATLRRLGFNRVSMGLQDLDPAVQEAVRRVQPLGLTREQVMEARRLGFVSVNIDLIYGLPLQTESGFRTTVRAVIRELAPDRVACFSYAHVPWIKPHQRALETGTLPTGWEKFRLFLGAAEELSAAGYRFVGFDHFARPGDELALALDEDRVHRNFMGYTVMPVLRSSEDELRRAVIHRIICSLALDYPWVERSFGIDPRAHFADALAALQPMAADGLVELEADGLRVTPAGRFFLRNLCMPFDAYLAAAAAGPTYSRTV